MAMLRSTLRIFVLCVCVLSREWACCDGLTADEAWALAREATAMLSKMSQSGIYETLTVNQVVEARDAPGRFHDNVVIKCVLGSTVQGLEQWKSDVEFVVMRDKEDREVITSVAVDNLPGFPKEIEDRFQVRQNEIERERRNEVLDGLEDLFVREQLQAVAKLSELERRVELARALEVLPLSVLKQIETLVLKDESRNEKLLENINVELSRRLKALERFELGRFGPVP